MSKLRREQPLSTLSRQSSYLNLYQANTQPSCSHFSTLQQPQTRSNEFSAQQTATCFNQPPLPQLLWCSTTGCDGSGTEATNCPTCKWMIRDHSQYRHISLPNGAQNEVQNTRHDPENEETARFNQMRTLEQELLAESIEQIASTNHQPRTKKRNHKKAFHAHPPTKTAWQLQADNQHREMVQEQRRRQELRYWYSEAQKVQALVEKEGWIDESEMWRTDDVSSEGREVDGLFVKF